MAEEKELLTILSKDEYKQVMSRMQKKFGNPKNQKRLSLQANNYDNEDIDTRIRITDGEVELMQKVGDWKNIIKGKSRSETIIPLPKNAKLILALYKIICNLTRGPNAQTIVMQYSNLLWKADGFEIKLTRQFGKGEGHNCEIEVSDHTLDPSKVAKELDIPIHPPGQTQDFWKKWNEKVNLNADKLSDEELLEIVKKYLD